MRQKLILLCHFALRNEGAGELRDCISCKQDMKFSFSQNAVLLYSLMATLRAATATASTSRKPTLLPSKNVKYLYWQNKKCIDTCFRNIFTATVKCYDLNLPLQPKLQYI